MGGARRMAGCGCWALWADGGGRELLVDREALALALSRNLCMAGEDVIGER